MELLKNTELSNTQSGKAIKTLQILCASAIIGITSPGSYAMSNQERLFQWDINRELCHMQNLSKNTPNGEKKAYISKHIRDLHLLRKLQKIQMTWKNLKTKKTYWKQIERKLASPGLKCNQPIVRFRNKISPSWGYFMTRYHVSFRASLPVFKTLHHEWMWEEIFPAWPQVKITHDCVQSLK